MSWPTAFVWTCAIELPVYTLVLGGCFRRWWSLCLLVLAANLVTHPALWFVMPRFDPYWLWILSAEMLVVLVEAALFWIALRQVRARAAGARALGAALAANAASTAVGLLFFA